MTVRSFVSSRFLATAVVVVGVLSTVCGCRTIAAAADPMVAEDCRVFIKGAGEGQVVVEGLDAYAVTLGIRRHLASLQGHRLLFDTPLGGRETGTYDGRTLRINAGLTTVTSTSVASDAIILEGTRYKKRFLFNAQCSPKQAALGTYALFELSRRRQKY